MGGLDQHLLKNESIIAERSGLGDKTDIPRIIDHYVYFRGKSAAERADLELRKAGFGTAMNAHALKTQVQATMESPADLQTINDQVRTVFNIVFNLGGDYDGWGAAIETQGF